MTTLLTAPINQTVEIIDIIAPPDFIAHLSTLGFVPGEFLTPLVKVGFGGPIAVALRGYRIALRRKDAECITVKPL